METKRCSACTETLPHDAFSKDRTKRDGLRSRCRPCYAVTRKRDPLKERAYALKYYYERQRDNPEFKSYRKGYIREHYIKNRDRYRAQAKKYRKTEIGKQIHREHEAVRRLRRPEITRAHNAVNVAIRSGALIRPSQCSRCGGSQYQIEAHHHRGYEPERRLDVVWLCAPCHREADGNVRRVGLSAST